MQKQDQAYPAHKGGFSAQQWFVAEHDARQSPPTTGISTLIPTNHRGKRDCYVLYCFGCFFIV